MADVIDRETMKIYESVNTPDYPEPMFMVINGKILPQCDNKYWKIVNDEIVEMSTEEKAVIDYVPPIPEPTEEELTIKATNERRQNIQTDIKMIYPELSDELEEIRMVLAEEFPDNIRAQKYNTDIEIILAKYPKV